MAATRLVWTVLIGLTAHFWKHCDCACTFPSSLTGDFITSLDNDKPITFTSSTVEGFDFVALGQTYRLTYECHDNSGDTYLIKSTQTENILSVVWIYRCLELIKVTDDIYYFQYSMPYLPDASDYMKHTDVTTLTTSACTRSVAGNDAVPYILVKNSSISTASINCPNVFLGKYSYTAVNTSTECSDADMNSCVDKTVTAFNKTSCNAADVSYSANGDLHCGAYLVKSGVTYLYTINPEATVDFSTTQRFLCFALVESGSTVVGTVKAGACAASQTEALNGDYTLVFTPNTYTCPILDEVSSSTVTTVSSGTVTTVTTVTNGGGGSGFPVAIIAAVIAVLLIAIIAGVVGYCIWKNRKGRKVADVAKKEPEKETPRDEVKPEKEKESNNNSGESNPKEPEKPA